MFLKIPFVCFHNCCIGTNFRKFNFKLWAENCKITAKIDIFKLQISQHPLFGKFQNMVQIKDKGLNQGRPNRVPKINFCSPNYLVLKFSDFSIFFKIFPRFDQNASKKVNFLKEKILIAVQTNLGWPSLV
jgi:hypothetical protein